MPHQQNVDEGDRSGIRRRSLLKFAGMTARAAAAFGVDVPGLSLSKAFAQAGAIDVGGGDVGILNYAYALEQLEAGFYTQVIRSPFDGIRRHEYLLLRDIRDHEIAHRALGVRPWTGAFDRRLSKGQVLAAARPFIAG